MGQAGEQLVGKVSGKLLLSALLDIGSYENKEKIHPKYLNTAHLAFPSDSADVYLQFLGLERGLSKHTNTQIHT